MTPDDLKNKISQARAQGVPDEVTFKYLNDRGLIPKDKIVTRDPNIVTPASSDPLPDGMSSVNGDVYNTKETGVLPKVADFLGISKFGTAIGRTLNNFTGTPQNDLKVQMDSLNKSNDTFTKIIHDPNTTSEQKSHAVKQMKTNSQLYNNLLSNYDNISTAGLSDKQVIGSAINTAALIVPASRAEKAGASLFGGKVLKAVGSGLLSGTQYGALGGLGSGLEKKDSTLGSVLEDTLIGTFLGAAGGSVLGLGGAVATKGLRGAKNIVNTLSSKEGLYSKLADTNASILNMTKNQLTNETRFAKDTPLFIAKEAPDVSWNVTKEGRLDTQPVIDALEPKYHAEAQAFNLALKDSGEYGSLDVLQRDATAQAKKQFKGSDQDVAIEKINNEILAYKKQFSSNIINHNGDTILPIHVIDDIKSDLWSKTKFYNTPGDVLQSQTSFLMGNSAKNMIENTVKDAPIKTWNKRLGDFASAIKILNQRNGLKVGAGNYSKTGARILGGIAGHTLGGVPGEIAGMVTADQLLKMASDPNVKSFVLKKLLQQMREGGQQKIIDQVQTIMEKRASERLSRKLLPSPSYIPLGPETVKPPSMKIVQGKYPEVNRLKLPAAGKSSAPIILPEKGILSGQQKLREGITGASAAIPLGALPVIADAKKQTAFRETGSVTSDKYSFSRKNTNGSVDLGKYQINEATLKSYSNMFLGKTVTPKEFLASPALQEQFFEAEYEHLKKLGVKNLDTFLALHTAGWGDVSKPRIENLKKNPRIIKYLSNFPKK